MGLYVSINCLSGTLGRVNFLFKISDIRGYLLGVFMVVSIYGRVLGVRLATYSYLSYLQRIITMAR